MAHYGTLRDYRFSDDVDDIRGARIFDPAGEKLGTVKDVVFDHGNGELYGVMIDVGRRHVLIPSGHLFRSAAEENDFDTDIRRMELDSLPDFDIERLRSDTHWRDWEKRQQQALKRENERLEKDYKREFHDDPVEHRRGSDHLVTPSPDEMPPATKGAPYRVTGADLTPERLESKFPDTANTASKLTMRPAGTSSHAEDMAGVGLASPRWTGFQNIVRHNLHELRRGCPTCTDETKAA